MYCPKCGSENPDFAKFCGSCATALPTGAPPHVVNNPIAPTPGAQPAVTDGLKWTVGIGSVLIPILGFIMGISYMNDPNPAKKSVGKLWLILGCAGLAMYCFFSVAGRL